MPASQFIPPAVPMPDGRIRLTGSLDVPQDTPVRLRVTVTQANGAVAEVEQHVTGQTFEMFANRASGTEFDSRTLVRAVGRAIAEGVGANQAFQWQEDLPLIPAVDG